MFKGISSIDDFPKCAGEGAGGAIRASLGIASNENDVMRLVDVLSTMKDCSEEINEEYELPPLTC